MKTEGGAVADVPVRVQPYGRLRDPKLPWTKLQWVVEPAARYPKNSPPPPLFTGSWELRPRYDGIWATFSLVIQPDQWPAEFPSQLLLAANAVGAKSARSIDPTKDVGAPVPRLVRSQACAMTSAPSFIAARVRSNPLSGAVILREVDDTEALRSEGIHVRFLLSACRVAGVLVSSAQKR